jgi:hypothetical protein
LKLLIGPPLIALTIHKSLALFIFYLFLVYLKKKLALVYMLFEQDKLTKNIYWKMKMKNMGEERENVEYVFFVH